MIEAIAAVVAAIVAAFFVGSSRGKSKERARQAEQADDAYRETRRRIDDAQGDIETDTGVIRDWLRTRADK